MMRITRREALKLGLLAGSLFLTFMGLLRRGLASEPESYEYQRSTARRRRVLPPTSQNGQQFQVPLPIMPVLKPKSSDETTDYYEITQKKAQVQILAGQKTEIWGYNGLFPGPTIKGRVGRKTVVRIINQLPEATSTHLHGMQSLPEYDGYPEDLVQPSKFKDYLYPNSRAATYWYHDHAMHKTAAHIYNGLSGFYILQDDVEDSLNLPSGEFDVALAIRDALFNPDNSLRYTADGDTILVNGVPWPYMKVKNRKYRFRILNASTSTVYRLGLSSAEKFTVIGTDAGLMAEPVQTPNLVIAPGERYEIVIDFSEYPVGTQIVLNNLFGKVETQEQPGKVSFSNIMRFDVVQSPQKDNSVIPSRLRLHKNIRESEAVRTRNVSLNLQVNPLPPLWTLNNKSWNSSVFIAQPNLGDVEIWTFTNAANNTSDYHVIHMHLVHFRILDRTRNGVTRPPRPYERGFKDSVFIAVGETVRVITQFTPNKGKYVIHCHVLEHEDHDMMTQFHVV
jgi:spore coat protein A, manganese oxidase